jgi:putative membrane protein
VSDTYRPGTLRTVVTGAAMGAADVVPGFSGGTVALVGGIYPRLIDNVRAGAHVLSVVLRLRWRGIVPALRSLDWGFLVALLGGLALAVATLAATLDRLLDDEPVRMSALFLGLVLGAVVTARHQFRDRPTVRLGAAALVSAVVTFLALGMTPGTIARPSPFVLFVAASIAVCAMILPGISGSFVLLLLGVYEPVISAISQRDLTSILAVILGMVVGLASFATLLHWLLARAHDLVLAVLVGLMVGSARVLWPWPSATGVGDPTLGAPSGDVIVPVIVALVAFAAVVLIGRRLRPTA